MIYCSSARASATRASGIAQERARRLNPVITLFCAYCYSAKQFNVANTREKMIINVARAARKLHKANKMYVLLALPCL